MALSAYDAADAAVSSVTSKIPVLGEYLNDLGEAEKQGWQGLKRQWQRVDEVQAGIPALGNALLAGVDAAGMAFEPFTQATKEVIGKPVSMLLNKADEAVNGTTNPVTGEPARPLTSPDSVNELVQAAIPFAGEGQVAKMALNTIDRAVTGLPNMKVIEEIQKHLDPAGVDAGAAAVGRITRASNGHLQADIARDEAYLESARQVTDKMGKEEQLEFIHKMETGESQAHPYLDDIAKMLREKLDEGWQKVANLGPDHQAAYRQNYFPHYWKESSDVNIRQTQGKRPLKGSQGFKKQRVFPTTAEGIAAGYEPITTNPIDLSLLKLSEMNRYYRGVKLSETLKKSGLVKHFKQGDDLPDGWKFIDDPAFETWRMVYQDQVTPMVGKLEKNSGVMAGMEDTNQQLGALEKKMEQAKASKTPLRLHDALDDLLGATRDPHVKTLAMRLRGAVGNIAVHVQEKIDGESGILGVYSRSAHQIGIRSNNPNLTHTLLHETVHAGTVDWYRANRAHPTAQKLDALLQEARTLAGNDMHQWYGLQPNHANDAVEFIAEALSNPKFQEYLAGLEGKRGGQPGNILQRLKDLVKNIFGVKDPNEARLLEQAIDASTEVLDRQAAGPQRAVKPPAGAEEPPWEHGGSYEGPRKPLGYMKTGAYAAPENTARVLNNHLSRSALRGALGGALDYARSTATAMNMVQLSMSAFHAGMTAIDAMSSHVALAVKEASKGNLKGAASKFLSAPAAPATTLLRGAKLRDAILNPGNASPELQKIVQAFELAGGRVAMPRYYGVTGAGSYVPAASRAIKSLWGSESAGTRGGALKHLWNDLARNFESERAGAGPEVFAGIARTAGRAVQSSSAWLMEYIVPRQKLGVFADMAAHELRAKPNMPVHELVERMQKAWDSVDNRMGELNYDNLFWNKTLRDASHIAIRSVGWNLGTVRELGGGAWDWVNATNEFLQGGNPEMTHRMAYTAGFSSTAAVLGAVTGYLMTGKKPEQPIDYFFPQTGGTNPDGTPERLSLPTYAKDVVEYATDPTTTVTNKLAPWVSFAYDLSRNRDYYGAEIYDPQDPWLERQKDVAKYFAEQWIPFPIRNVQKAPPDSKIPKWAQFAGVVRAPRAITSDGTPRPPRLEDRLAHKRKLREEQEGLR
jgi:hypothetical protein